MKALKHFEFGRIKSVFQDAIGSATYAYNDNCEQQTLNALRVTGTCFTSLGNLASQIIGKEEIMVTTLHNNNVTNILPYNIRYKYNPYVEIQTSNAGSPLFGNSPVWDLDGPGWGEQKVSSSTPDHRYTEFDSQGRMLKTEFKTFDDPDPWWISQENQYTHGLLKHSSWVNVVGQNLVDLTYQHTSDGQISSADAVVGDRIHMAKTLSYNSFGRIIQESTTQVQPNAVAQQTTTCGTGTIEITYSYEQNHLMSLLPFIRGIEYDIYDRVVRITYRNGQRLERDYDGNSNRVTRIEMRAASGKTLFRETYRYNSIHQLEQKSLTSSFKTADESYTYDHDNYFLMTGGAGPRLAERDTLARAVGLNKRSFLYRDGELSSTALSQQNCQKIRRIKDTTKNGEKRIIPLFEEANDVIENQRKITGNCEFVFGGRSPLDSSHFNRELQVAVAKLPQLPKIAFHDLRHTFCSRLESTGMSRKIVSAIMGHKDLRTTERYSHANERMIGDEVLRWQNQLNRQSSGKVPANF